MKILYIGIECPTLIHGGEYTVARSVKRPSGWGYVVKDEIGGEIFIPSSAYKLIEVPTIHDGFVMVVSFAYVSGPDWAYMYSDTYHEIGYNVYQCMSGEVVAVLDSDMP